MDRNEVVRCALLGAAKVAFSAALVGCGGIVLEDRSAGAGGAGTTSAAAGDNSAIDTSAASTGAGQTSSVSSVGSTSSTSSGGQGGAPACEIGSGPPYDDATVVCCNQLVVDTFPPGEPTPPVPNPASPELIACCGVALEARDHPTMNGPTPVPWDSGYACCAIPDVVQPKPFSATCTPWGPPSPPAMPSDLVWIEEAA